MLVTTQIHQGKLSGHASQLIRRELENLEGEEVEIAIIKKRARRSNEQNALLWVWYEPMADWTGYTEEELHELFKARLLGYDIFYLDGVGYIKPKSSRKLSKKRFTELLEKVMFVAEWLGLSNQLIGE